MKAKVGIYIHTVYPILSSPSSLASILQDLSTSLHWPLGPLVNSATHRGNWAMGITGYQGHWPSLVIRATGHQGHWPPGPLATVVTGHPWPPGSLASRDTDHQYHWPLGHRPPGLLATMQGHQGYWPPGLLATMQGHLLFLKIKKEFKSGRIMF